MRLSTRFIASAAALLAVAACSDTATSPTAATPNRVSAEGAPAFDFANAGRIGISTTSFTVTPNGGTFSVAGLYQVSFPANAVCNPSTTNYATGAGCTPLTSNITVQATVQLTGNGLAVDFQPELRFVDGSPVTISTSIFAPLIVLNRSFFAQHPSALNPLAMLYTPSLGAAAIPDYLTDPDAITHINLTNGQIWRHVKHFSGYSITGGSSCDPSDPTCVQVDGGGGF